MTNYFHKYISCHRTSSDYKTNLILPAILAGFMFFAGSCEDPPSLRGKDLLPDSDFVTIKSSLLTVESYTAFYDSVSSGMPSVSYLGSIYDPYFGTTTGEFVSQLRLGSEWGKTSFVVDSVRLFLRLLNVKGDTASQHYLKMSEIADVIYDTATYYSGQSVPLTGYTIPDILLPSLKADTVNNIVLKVDSLFGVYLLRDTSMLFHSGERPDFRSYFRGLYFQLISPVNPVLLSLSVASSTGSGYYSNFFEVYGKDSFGTSKVVSFLLDAVTTNASFNLYRHDHSTAMAGKKIEHINDFTYLDTLSYAQTFNGVYSKLILTKLDSIKNAPEMENISVNKARLKIPVYYDHDLYKRSTIPSTLYLRYRTSSGSRYLVPETNTAFYNGTSDTTAVSEDDDVYNLNIATFVQGYLEDKTNTILPELELFLLPSAGNNVILRANGSFKPIKFEFTYTKF
jgi:hypothetical protein